MGEPRPGPYRTTSGPEDGPVRRRHRLPAVGVHSADGGPWPIGIAIRVGEPGGHDQEVVVFRLEVDGVELPGRYVVDRRRLVLAAGWAPRQRGTSEGPIEEST